MLNQYGEELLGHFEAQYAITDDGPPGAREVIDTNPLQPLAPHGYLEWARYERLYGMWKDGWVTDEQVKSALGTRVLEIMAQQSLGRGPPPTTVVPHVEGCVPDVPDRGMDVNTEPQMVPDTEVDDGEGLRLSCQGDQEGHQSQPMNAGFK